MGILAGEVALKNLDILTLERHLMVVVGNKARGLQPMHQGILLVKLPVEGRSILVVVPPAIKPYSADRALVGKKLGNLAIHKVVVRAPVNLRLVTACDALCSTTTGVVITAPVGVRVVEVEGNTLLLALLG